MTPGPYCRNRQFEWFTTTSLLGMGMLMAIWPSTMSASSFRYILMVMSPESLTFAYLCIGFFRVEALIANGNWFVWGPRIRALGAVAGASIWLQMDIALIIWTTDNNLPPSPGMAMFSSAIAFEFFSTYRAMSDGRSYTGK